MSGNYDVKVVAEQNVTSFKSQKDEKKQFIGTSWNESAYIKDDVNAGTVFEAGKGMTLKLNSRYKKGGEAVFSNLDKKHTGISYDLLDKFIEAAADGKLVDADHQGYTKENMLSFGKAFEELRKEKLADKDSAYSSQYSKMKNGTEFNFSASELEKLYKAAGFELVKKEAPAEAKTVAADVPKAEVPQTILNIQKIVAPFAEKLKTPAEKELTMEEAMAPYQKGGEKFISDMQSQRELYFIKNVTYSKSWNGRYSVEKDKYFNQFFGSYERVTTKDDRKLCAVVSGHSYPVGTPIYKYYEPTVIMVHSKVKEGYRYWQVVPDLTKEVTDAEFEGYKPLPGRNL